MPPAFGRLDVDEAPDLLPASIVAKAALATFVAVVFVHLFAGPIEPVGAFAAHALLITAAYTAAFALTYVALQRIRRFAFARSVPAPLLVAALSAVACLAGSAVLGALKDAGGAVGGVIDVHDDANWALKLLPLWFVMTAVLYQSERTRLLEAELRRLGQIRMQEPAPASPATETGRMIEIGAGKAAAVLRVDDVAYIMAVENYCEVHFVERAARKPLLVRATLASVIDLLPPDFVRTHRSYVVNLASVESIGKQGRAYAAALADGRSVPVSRGSADGLSARWRDFLQAGTRGEA
jgi:DNA-binding LytR/AlgR family response regulator